MTLTMSSQNPKVHITIALSTRPPHSLSLSPPQASETLTLTATVRQVSSPDPSKPITLLKRHTALDDTATEDAFVLRRMRSPTSVEDPDKVIRMYPYEMRVTHIRPNGDLDIRKREGFDFIEVPSVDSGESAEVHWQLSTASMLRFGRKPIEEQLKAYRPGERFKITVASFGDAWWTWGSLDGELAEKRFSRWQLPADREDGDVSEDVASRLRDPITGHNVNKLSSRSCVDGEQKPDIAALTEGGWVFSEPREDLVIECTNDDEGGVFEFVD